MVIRATALLICLAAVGCAAHPADVAQPTPTAGPITVGTAPESPELRQLSHGDSLRYAAMASRTAACPYAYATARIRGIRYIGCSGSLVALGPARDSHTKVDMSGINSIVPIGVRDIGVTGWCCEPIRSMATVLDERTLRPVLRKPLLDSTLLGVVGDRVYIDDWCCNGRADVYSPATIYSISLSNGDESAHTDLKPDPDAHPGDQQPLGQGEKNFLVGTSLYVVVGTVTYRYDILDLSRPPLRLATPRRFDAGF